MDLILDAFHSAAERDIYTGDQLEVLIIEPSGVTKQYFPLRKDWLYNSQYSINHYISYKKYFYAAKKFWGICIVLVLIEHYLLLFRYLWTDRSRCRTLAQLRWIIFHIAYLSRIAARKRQDRPPLTQWRPSSPLKTHVLVIYLCWSIPCSELTRSGSK